MQEVSVGRADIQNIKEPVDGVTHLKGSIQAGKQGRESSWKVYSMADVQVSSHRASISNGRTDECDFSTSCELPFIRRNL